MKERPLAGGEAPDLVALPEGYHGKILLVTVTAGIRSWTLLRSGGRWHRDILKNCETELLALGLAGARLSVRGGAHLRFREDGALLLWGRSEEFGTCDYRLAALLLKRRWPERPIHWPGGEMP